MAKRSRSSSKRDTRGRKKAASRKASRGGKRNARSEANVRFDAARPVTVDPVLPSADVRARVHGLDLRCKGGMGEIWNVVDVNLRRRMVKKVLRPEHRQASESLHRLIVEAQVMAQLDHSNIPAVHDLGVDSTGNVYMTMQLIRGQTLADILDGEDPGKRGEPEIRRQLRIFLSVCEAIAFAHSCGVINRDIKAENVMVGDFGEVYVLDWGFAKLLDDTDEAADDGIPRLRAKRFEKPSEENMIVGTPSCLSPEQALAEIDQHDERTDIFGLGALLYRIITGDPPYQGTAREKVMQAQRCEPIPLKKAAPWPVPEALCRVVARAMQKEQTDRYQSALEIRDDLQEILDEGWQFAQRRYKAGKLILREGAKARAACIIVEGVCRAFRKVSGKKRTVGKLMGAGDCFGEVALFAGRPRTASVEAVTDVTLLVVPARRFSGMDSVLADFVKGLAERFREKDDRILELKRELSKARQVEVEAGINTT